MITTDPIGDWTWEITPSHGDARPSRAVEITTAIWRILAKFDLATPPGRISFSARPRGNMSDTWVHVQDQILHAGSFRSGTTISDAVSRVEKMRVTSSSALGLSAPACGMNQEIPTE